MNLIDSFSLLEGKWYQDVLDQMKLVMPNQGHVDGFAFKENEALEEALGLKIGNAGRHYKNYEVLLGGRQEFSFFRFDLVGVNKACFASQGSYEEVFDFGVLADLFGLEVFSIQSNGSGLEGAHNSGLKGKSIRQLERQLSDYSLQQHSDTGITSPKHNILANQNQPDFTPKLMKTVKNINLLTIQDLHSLASNSIQNIYTTQTKAKEIFLALLILSAMGIFILACAEYDYRITRRNKCTKVCYFILLALVFIGVVVCLILLIISAALLSSILSKMKEKVCIDLKMAELVADDITLGKVVIPLAVGLGLCVFSAVLGVLLSCHFCGTRWKYRLWKSFGGRFS